MNSELYRIYNIDDVGSYKKYFKYVDSVEDSYDAMQILPDHVLENWQTFINNCQQDLLTKDCGRYIDSFNRTEKLFNSLSAAKINALAHKAMISVETNDTIKSILKTFKYNRERYAKRAKYNRAANISGRLVVNRGPNILTLPRRCRSILDTRFKHGKVISIDFSALEPRLCLKLNGVDIEGDLYDYIMQKSDMNIDRSVIKRAVISVLYGAHYTSLKNISENRAKELFDCIKELFGLDHILEMSTNEDELGIRRNFFGRPLWNKEETKEHILINNYIQSSAVDLAVNYFTDLIDTLDLQKAVPLFILHDAMIFDLDEDYKEEFVNIINKGYNNESLGYFPLKIDIFNTTEEINL